MPRKKKHDEAELTGKRGKEKNNFLLEYDGKSLKRGGGRGGAKGFGSNFLFERSERYVAVVQEGKKPTGDNKDYKGSPCSEGWGEGEKATNQEKSPRWEEN